MAAGTRSLRNWRSHAGQVERRLQQDLIRLRHPGGHRSRAMGVNLLGWEGAHSLAGMTRHYRQALESAGIPVTVHLLEEFMTEAGSGRRRRSGPGNDHAFTITLIHPMFLSPRNLPVRFTTGRYVIANWIWEQTELPPSITGSFDRVDEVWASSQFVQDVYTRSTDRPVTLIPHPIRSTGLMVPPMSRRQLGIPEDRYAFLTIAATSSSLVRKNPLGSMHAFRRAFPHGQTEAALVIKMLVDQNTPSAQDQRRLFTSDPAHGPDVIIVAAALTDDEMTSLTEVCDAFISLSRAEGFGLGPAEAMSLGKPVIVTNWSGPVDYLTESNSLPVPFSLRRIDDPRHDIYLPGLEWAEPDLEAAAQRMRALVDQPELGPTLGGRAAIDMARHSVAAVGAVMAARLEEIHRR